MSQEGFELTISMNERLKTVHVLDHSAIVNGGLKIFFNSLLAIRIT
jgi:hypothetical protein